MDTHASYPTNTKVNALPEKKNPKPAVFDNYFSVRCGDDNL